MLVVDDNGLPDKAVISQTAVVVQFMTRKLFAAKEDEVSGTMCC